MGARGPIAKRDDERQTNRAPVRATGTPEHEQHVLPAAPKGMLKRTRDQWVTFWESDLVRVTALPDLAPITRLFRYYDEWNRLHDEHEARLRAGGAEAVVTYGSQGQQVAHPLPKRLNELEGLISKLEDKLGITPMARARLGIALGLQEQTWQQVAAGRQVGRTGEEKHDERIRLGAGVEVLDQ